MSRYLLRFTALGYVAFLLLVPVGFVFYRAFGDGSSTPGTPSRPTAPSLR
jgi:ABC-type sulfate transport system permease subunit